ATVNLRPFPTASVHLGRAEGHDPTDTEGIWLDPARRAPARGGTRRLHDPEEYDPPLSTVVELASRLGRHGEHGPLGAKLGPGIDPGVLPARTETQWLSLHGQVLEATCWFGPLAAPGTRSSALVITRAGAHRLERTDDSPSDPSPGPLRDHLYEPDGAVIRAGLIGQLAAQLDAHTIDASRVARRVALRPQAPALLPARAPPGGGGDQEARHRGRARGAAAQTAPASLRGGIRDPDPHPHRRGTVRGDRLPAPRSLRGRRGRRDMHRDRTSAAGPRRTMVVVL